MKINCLGREVVFENHGYHGPFPVTKSRLDPMDRIPKGFWDAIERWQLNGKATEADIAIAPEWCRECGGSGTRSEPINQREVITIGPCKYCDGSRLAKTKLEKKL